MRTTIVMPPTADNEREPYTTLTLNEDDIEEVLVDEDRLLGVLEDAGISFEVWTDTLLGQYIMSIRQARRLNGGGKQPDRPRLRPV